MRAGVRRASGSTTSTTRCTCCSTGERDGYYSDFGSLAQFADTFRHAPPERFVVYSQNHDQVGNRALGDRLRPELQPLAAFCTLLSPYVPLLFMGEEYGERAPFQFFSDHIDPKIAEATRRGRREEFAAFAGFAEEEIPDPQDPATFERSKLTRELDPRDRAAVLASCSSSRRELPSAPVDALECDEDAAVAAGAARAVRARLQLRARERASTPATRPCGWRRPTTRGSIPTAPRSPIRAPPPRLRRTASSSSRLFPVRCWR